MPAETSYDGNDLLKDLSNEYSEYKRLWREEHNVPMPHPDDLYAQNRERIETLKQVLFRIINDRKIIGEAMLATLWNLYRDELWRYDSEEWDMQPDNFNQYVEIAILGSGYVDVDTEDKRYFNAMKAVVENIFSVVHHYEQSGNPILDDNDNPITVERLITTKGLISKLKEWSYRIGSSGNNPELQRDMIGAVTTRTRSQLDEYRNQLDQLPTIEFVVSVNDSGYTIHAEHIDRQRYELMIRLLGRYAQVRLT